MSVQWSKNPQKIGGGTRVLVPGHQNSGARYVPDWLKHNFFFKTEILADHLFGSLNLTQNLLPGLHLVQTQHNWPGVQK